MIRIAISDCAQASTGGPPKGLCWLAGGALLFFGATAMILQLALKALVAAPYTYLAVKTDPDTLKALADISKAILPPHVQTLPRSAATGLAPEAGRISGFLARHDWLYDQITHLRRPDLEARMAALHQQGLATGTTDPALRHLHRREHRI